MDVVLRARALGKRYRRRWALADCTLEVPAGRVVGLVGPNGAGKSTLLNLASGMLAPSTGTIEVCGGRPGEGPAQLAKVGFVAQDTPTYVTLTVADHLSLGARLNLRWDNGLAHNRIRGLGLNLAERVGNLSGGQRAQLALTLGIAKRPELLILDEPVAALDPLARREFLADLREAIADQQMSVVLSSHLVSDLEMVCDHLIVLVSSRVQVAGDIDDLLATHHRLTGPRHHPADVPPEWHVLSAEHTGDQTTLLVRTDAPPTESHPPAWTVSRPTLEDIVLAYMTRPATTDHTPYTTALETQR
ncbi:ABC transporter ATP-binding protein [Streptomyces sp. NPDC087425]|uniref:ABC transporter ATP-binding protein n=1 Tax=Streptomyces sp. NPDC087425 TaxID=3365787 RepID=UPI0038131FBF